MLFSLLNLFRGLRTDLDVVTMLRGETHVEIVPEGHVMILWLARGAASISRARAAGSPGLHVSPRLYEPVFLTTPGTYFLTARDHVLGVRVLRRAEGERA